MSPSGSADIGSYEATINFRQFCVPDDRLVRLNESQEEGEEGEMGGRRRGSAATGRRTLPAISAPRTSATWPSVSAWSLTPGSFAALPTAKPGLVRSEELYLQLFREPQLVRWDNPEYGENRGQPQLPLAQFHHLWQLEQQLQSHRPQNLEGSSFHFQARKRHFVVFDAIFFSSE